MKKLTKFDQKLPPLPKLQKTAIDAAVKGGKILSDYFGKKLKVSEKKEAGLVTNADLESEEKIIRILKKQFPHFGILSEESDPKLSQSPGRWIIDPLDGTTNYVHGFPVFCVSIAAEWDGQLVVGVIYHPILKETYVAVRGKGAFINGKKMKVSKSNRLESSLLTTGFTYRKTETLEAEMRLFAQLSGLTRAIRRPGSAALDLAYTARGVFDAFWERRLSPWDVAAGILLVEEAGGQVTDFQGNPCQLDCGQLIASNPILHPLLLEQIKIAREKNKED